MNESTTEKLQILEQNLQNYSQQRQQYQIQLKEVESALSELEGSKEQYKIIGNIMVNSSKEDLQNDLKKKKETFELRIKNFQTQEEKLQKKAKELQEEIMKEGQGDENAR
ncbi:MAG: prefoldin subunit beta [Candidatus Nanoarchaeia archaeon]